MPEIIQLPQNGGNQNGGATILPVANGGGLFGNCNQVPYVDGYVPYLMVTNITVGTDSVNLAMGNRDIFPTGTFFARIGTAIPTGTTGTKASSA